jgi:lipopolysaccharide transport system ATP-binding protein
MSDIAIKCEGLSKQYRIGERESYKALRDVITETASAPFRRVRSAFSRNGTNGETRDSKLETRNSNRFWALQDVSFEVRRGEVIGIVGRNGAGKSTLLKILSRITKPTKGHAEIHGRVGSLLEVGTGFHPELTGRENIYLNAAILGMRKAEVERKFDEIVAFAEVEKFIDTPVKRYSSGMYVRLAFAVAAHMETEVLLVDEVLAVGDAEFQKKCLGKMRDIGEQGRTVLLVSHNMSVIQSLCERALLFHESFLKVDNDAASSVKIYLNDSLNSNSFIRPMQPNGEPTITQARIATISDGPNPCIRIDAVISTDKQRCVSLDLQLTDGIGTPIGFGSLGTLNSHQQLDLTIGSNPVAFIVPIAQLALGMYWLSLDLTRPEIEFYDRVQNCLSFEIARAPSHGATRVLPQSWNYGSLEINLIPQ